MAPIEPKTVDRRPLAAPSFSQDWRVELRSALRTAEDLASAGLIPADSVEDYRPVLAKYRFVLPRYYADLIDRNDPNCPIALQCIPSRSEMVPVVGMVADPLRDIENQPTERITHRYQDRVLIHLTPSCSMYCRFCFRKSLLNELSSELFGGQIESALAYVAERQEIREIIFSGGDPFLSSETNLAKALRSLDAIPHLLRVRFHTRVPVTLPMRVTQDFASLVTDHRKKTIVVTHFNHPREITPHSAKACATLRAAGITMLNQSVLLRGVNDDASTLELLSERLFEAGVLPYYLHHLDQAAGTIHFAVSMERGKQIYRELRTRISGYLVPRYVVDRVDFPYKSFAAEL